MKFLSSKILLFTTFAVYFFQSSRTDILDLLLNAEEVEIGSGGLADSITQLLSVNMDSDAQKLQEKSSKQEENGIKKKKKKKGLTTEVQYFLDKLSYYVHLLQSCKFRIEILLVCGYLGKVGVCIIFREGSN